MYHHHNHQGKNIQYSNRVSINQPDQRHMFLQGVNDDGDSGLVLSTDAKPRLKWTPDLHERFIEADLFEKINCFMYMSQIFSFQSVLEKAQETIGGQNLGTVGLEAAKVQISDLVYKVSTQCLNSTFSGMKEISDLYNNLTALKPVNFGSNIETRNNIDNETRLQKTELRWKNTANHNVDKAFPSEPNSSNLSMSIGFHVDAIGKYPDERYNGGDSNGLMKMEKKKTSSEMKMPFFPTRLDLNTDVQKNDTDLNCKQLDLNGFSWG